VFGTVKKILLWGATLLRWDRKILLFEGEPIIPLTFSCKIAPAQKRQELDNRTRLCCSCKPGIAEISKTQKGAIAHLNKASKWSLFGATILMEMGYKMGDIWTHSIWLHLTAAHVPTHPPKVQRAIIETYP